ncbi:anthranilate phosphoribosyltransferase [Georgenia satyanarayanai]|uniref:anthranilate phosphoribosyltransferase n=1 Tax=Georgenia satyanarayanai TaxID=860221 RepID=UPI0012650D4C|nr:anthranilate phosphoribosyltransferase [Georgenia satyanarayanai]
MTVEGVEPVQPTWADLITSLVAGEHLSATQTGWAMDQVMSGLASPVQLAGFLVALRAKGETVAELTGLADVMLAHSVPIDVPDDVVDIVGTGGDRARTVNISTMSSLVIAGAGVPVVKHGNRASSSASGSADVLEELGVRLDMTVPQVEAVFREVGITFCFAQTFHPSFRHTATARRELAVPTAFNVLGPLTNPARPRAAAIGVADRRVAPLVAGVLARRGTRGLVFRGEDGLDELTTTAASRVWHVADGEVTEHLLDTREVFGLTPSTVEDLRGADATFNAGVARDILDGATGPVRDAVLLNSAAALVAHGRLPGTRAEDGDLVTRLRAAMDLAAAAIDDGRARGVLDRWAAASAAL